MSKEAFEFVVYLIHACSRKWERSPSDVFKSLQESGCIDGYLVPHYDILHTQSTDFVVEDIEEYLAVREGSK